MVHFDQKSFPTDFSTTTANQTLILTSAERDKIALRAYVGFVRIQGTSTPRGSINTFFAVFLACFSFAAHGLSESSGGITWILSFMM